MMSSKFKPSAPADRTGTTALVEGLCLVSSQHSTTRIISAVLRLQKKKASTTVLVWKEINLSDHTTMIFQVKPSSKSRRYSLLGHQPEKVVSRGSFMTVSST
ncbi:uncharacterized protein LOC111245438 [Varroa destructor]|uniref:Uncharacterized protein n=1 Tax=Varroa destructor TaxID=109461 RepID=A0A7M7JBN9_VARDE|nr:uncharacterized protein LOC111245438 [Varroa destructor]